MKNTLTFDDTKHLTVDKAAELLHKSSHCVRQLMFRKKILTHSINGRTFLDFDSVLTYHARKKGIPSLELNIDTIKNHKSLVPLELVAQELMVQTSYIIKLVKNKTLEGYVTSSGEVLISKDSINTYQSRVNVTSDL